MNNKSLQLGLKPPDHWKYILKNIFRSIYLCNTRYLSCSFKLIFTLSKENSISFLSDFVVLPRHSISAEYSRMYTSCKTAATSVEIISMHISEACSLFLCWLRASGGLFWKNSQWPRAPGSPYVMCLCTLCNFHILWQPSDCRDIRRADSSSFPALTTWLLRRYSEEKKPTNNPWPPLITYTNGIALTNSWNRRVSAFLIFSSISPPNRANIRKPQVMFPDWYQCKKTRHFALQKVLLVFSRVIVQYTILIFQCLLIIIYGLQKTEFVKIFFFRKLKM